MIFVMMAALISGVSVLTTIGFLITLIVGAANGSKKARMTGLIGLISSIVVFVVTVFGIAASAMYMSQNDLTKLGPAESSKVDSDYDDSDIDSDSDDEDYDINPDDDSSYDHVISKIKQQVEFVSGEKVTVNEIKKTDEKLNGESVVVADITVENPTKDKIYFSAYNFELDGGVSSEEGDLDYKKSDEDHFPDVLEPGKKYNLKLFFKIDATDKFSVVYKHNIWK